MDLRMSDYSRVLCLLDEFKRAYKEENGVLTVGNIENLVNYVELIKDCVNKRRDKPTKNEKIFKLFGKMEWIKYCSSCGAMVDSEQGYYCPKCGQRFC